MTTTIGEYHLACQSTTDDIRRPNNRSPTYRQSDVSALRSQSITIEITSVIDEFSGTYRSHNTAPGVNMKKNRGRRKKTENTKKGVKWRKKPKKGGYRGEGRLGVEVGSLIVLVYIVIIKTRGRRKVAGKTKKRGISRRGAIGCRGGFLFVLV